MNDDKHLRETRLRSQQVYRGDFLDVRRDEVALPDGGVTTREYIVHPGAVVIVPLLDEERLVMVRQYRYPLSQVLLEFPAGKIDPDEPTLRTAQRELAEETGYTASQWARAGVLHNAAAYADECIEVWFARGLVPGTATPDAGEFIETCVVGEAELDALAGAGDVTDAKTLIGLLWLQRWRAGSWHFDWVPR